jgi:hypothetical protein
MAEDSIKNPVLSQREMRKAARRSAEKLFAAREQRWTIAKREAGAASAAKDANTERLRALRLARSVTGKDTARMVTQPATIVPYSSGSLIDASQNGDDIPNATATSK